jgi:hypothetical protein
LRMMKSSHQRRLITYQSAPCADVSRQPFEVVAVGALTALAAFAAFGEFGAFTDAEVVAWCDIAPKRRTCPSPAAALSASLTRNGQSERHRRRRYCSALHVCCLEDAN